MNVNSLITMDYENKHNWTIGQNKPNSNPIKANFQKAQMNINSLITKDYRKKDDFIVRINKPNLVRRRRIPKMNVNLYVIEDYENKTTLRPQKNKPKQTQFKPNFFKGQNELKIACQKIWPKFLVIGAYAMGAYSQSYPFTT